MRRRDFLKFAAACAAAIVMPQPAFATVKQLGAENSKILHRVPSQEVLSKATDHRLKDYLTKIRNPDLSHPSDLVLSGHELQLLYTVVAHLERLCSYIGFANFSIVGFDEALRLAARQLEIGEFSKSELDFLEMIYGRDASDYGFFGEKQVVKLTATINERDIAKIPGTGNYLFKGDAIVKYEEIKKLLGEEAILTSGIRGVVKQFYLFLDKARRNNGNLSLASRSLAPPGYSYHATGDFDIGQRGLGGGNFSERFTETPVFKTLTERGFVEYRYKRDNMLGVRYEPWHIKLAFV